MKRRKIILHYHLFKNAGTSIDAALKDAFGEEKWVTKEFPKNPQKNINEVKQWIVDNPEAICFSSHTAFLPIPKIDSVEVFPVIFLRNPLDRVVSAYYFEKKQNSKNFGAVLAKHTDLEGYINVRLSLPKDRQCKNFQTHRLSMAVSDPNMDELNKAYKAIQQLPFIGIVENFNDSILNLSKKLSLFFKKEIILPPKKKNISKKENKGNAIISDKLKKSFFSENMDDIRILDLIK